jgi:hypothetical protein
MLYMFGFEKLGVVVGDVFFVDPRPAAGQEGAESGVRVELRHLPRVALRGSIYSAQPIAAEAPLLRVDLFETFPAGRGSCDRVHFHPSFDGWDPGERHFDPLLSSDPAGWLHRHLRDVGSLSVHVGPDDRAALAARTPEIVAAVDRLWTTVRSGALDPPGGWTVAPSFRRGWL